MPRTRPLRDAHVAFSEAARVVQNPDEARKKARVAFDVKANQVVPQEQVQERIIEETIDVVAPQVVEEPAEVVKHFPGEQV